MLPTLHVPEQFQKLNKLSSKSISSEGKSQSEFVLRWHPKVAENYRHERKRGGERRIERCKISSSLSLICRLFPRSKFLYSAADVIIIMVRKLLFQL